MEWNFMISLAYEYWSHHIIFIWYVERQRLDGTEKMAKFYICEMKACRSVMVKACGYWQ